MNGRPTRLPRPWKMGGWKTCRVGSRAQAGGFEGTVWARRPGWGGAETLSRFFRIRAPNPPRFSKAPDHRSRMGRLRAPRNPHGDRPLGRRYVAEPPHPPRHLTIGGRPGLPRPLEKPCAASRAVAFGACSRRASTGQFPRIRDFAHHRPAIATTVDGRRRRVWPKAHLGCGAAASKTCAGRLHRVSSFGPALSARIDEQCVKFYVFTDTDLGWGTLRRGFGTGRTRTTTTCFPTSSRVVAQPRVLDMAAHRRDMSSRRRRQLLVMRKWWFGGLHTRSC